ncbi:MAG: hypothetical protein AAF567_24550 [Actinomycetota bacterium]
MSITSTPFTITAISDPAHFSTGGVGTLLDGLNSLVCTTGLVMPFEDGDAWFEAEADLPAGAAWISLNTEQRGQSDDLTGYFDIAHVDLFNIAWNSVSGVMPHRAINHVPIDEFAWWNTYLPRYARTIAGDAVWTLEDAAPSGLKVRVRVNVNVGLDTNLGDSPHCEIRTLGLETVTRPADPVAILTVATPTLALQATPPVDGPDPRAMKFTIVDDTTGETWAEGLTVDRNAVGNLEYQPDRLPVAGTYRITVSMLFDDFATLPVTYDTEIVRTIGEVGSPGDLIVEAEDDGYRVLYDQNQGSVERAAAWDADGTIVAWVPVHEGVTGAGGLDVLDYPPFNHPVTYRARRAAGNDVTPHAERVVSTDGVDRWVLTDAATGESIWLPFDSVKPSRDVTTTVVKNDIGNTVFPGVVLLPDWDVSSTITNSAEFDRFERIIASHELVWRGPFGQRHDVAVVGRIRYDYEQAHTGVDEAGFVGQQGPLEVIASIDFRLTVRS